MGHFGGGVVKSLGEFHHDLKWPLERCRLDVTSLVADSFRQYETIFYEWGLVSVYEWSLVTAAWKQDEKKDKTALTFVAVGHVCLFGCWSAT